MICNALTSSIAKSCESNAGGVSKIYIADFDNVTGITEAGTPNEITAITMAASTKFYEFEFNRNTSSYDENSKIDLTTGSSYWEQSVNLMLNRRDKTKRDAIEKLVAGQKRLVILVQDANGTVFMFGQNEGIYTTEITGGSGIARADKNGYAIKFTAEETAQANSVDPTIVAALLV